VIRLARARARAGSGHASVLLGQAGPHQAKVEVPLEYPADYHVVAVIVDLLAHGHYLPLHKAADDVRNHPILIRHEDVCVPHDHPSAED